jgi:hypothetical protein
MGFLAPWFFGGLALLSVPVFVHLLRHHVAIPRPVSSLMFFERGIQSSTRHHRLKHLVLLALRCALVLLVVLAFANPFVRRAAANTNGRLLLIVIDNSFSMRAGSRFADAKQQAMAKLVAKQPSQKTHIISLGGQLQILTQPIADAAQLRSALESIQPGDGRAGYGDLSRALRTIAENVHSPIDVHLYSDMQRSAMPTNFADLVLPPNVTLDLHSIANKIASNWTIESIDAPAELSNPKDPHRSRVRAVVAGFGTPAASKTISLVVNGKTAATHKVEVPANGRATVEFSPLEVNYGFNRCEVRIESGDAFAGDDATVFTVRRADLQRVLFVHSSRDTRSPVYFGSALTAASRSSLVLQSVSQEETTNLDPSRFAFVVLSDSAALPSIFEHTLAQYVARGGNVFIAIGTSAARRSRIPVWNGGVADTHDYAHLADAATIGEVDFTHPALLDAQPGRDNGGWAEAKVFYVAVVDPHGARIAARLSDGTPLLLDKQVGQGHVLLFTTGLENLTNDLPLHPVFVAFADRVARYLSGSERLSGSRLVDSYVPLRSPADSASEHGSIEVIGPDGRRPLSLSEAKTAQTLRLEKAGFYQIRLSNGRDMLIGVNPDRRESDLQPIPDDVLRLWIGSASSGASYVDAAAHEEGYRSVSLWWYVMLLAFIAALAEMSFASRYMSTQREEI